jgi:uncharacterized membrane protein HdeD (DUF308 family)
VTPRRTTLLVAAGVVLLAVGVASVLLGTRGRTWLSVVGILLVVAGLACLRIVFWVRRAARLTEIGRSLHINSEDPRASQTRHRG